MLDFVRTPDGRLGRVIGHDDADPDWLEVRLQPSWEPRWIRRLHLTAVTPEDWEVALLLRL